MAKDAFEQLGFAPRLTGSALDDIMKNAKAKLKLTDDEPTKPTTKENTIFDRPGFVGDVARTVADTGLGYMTAAANLYNNLTQAQYRDGGTPIQDKLIKAHKQINDIQDAADKATMSPIDYAEQQRIQQEFQNAKGVVENVKAGGKLAWNMLTNPIDNAGKIIGGLADPLNFVPAATGAKVAAKLGGGIIPKIGASMVAGAASNAPINAVEEGAFAAARGEDWQKAAAAGAGGGAVGGALLGPVGAVTEHLSTKYTQPPELTPKPLEPTVEQTANPILTHNGEIIDTEVAPKIAQIANQKEIIDTTVENTIQSHIAGLLGRLDESANIEAQQVKAQTQALIASGADRDSVARAVDNIITVSPEDISISNILNDGKPLSSRMMGVRLLPLLESSIQIANDAPHIARTNQEFAAALKKEGVSPELGAVMVNAYAAKDPSILQKYMWEKINANRAAIVDEGGIRAGISDEIAKQHQNDSEVISNNKQAPKTVEQFDDEITQRQTELYNQNFRVENGSNVHNVLVFTMPDGTEIRQNVGKNIDMPKLDTSKKFDFTPPTDFMKGNGIDARKSAYIRVINDRLSELRDTNSKIEDDIYRQYQAQKNNIEQSQTPYEKFKSGLEALDDESKQATLTLMETRAAAKGMSLEEMLNKRGYEIRTPAENPVGAAPALSKEQANYLKALRSYSNAVASSGYTEPRSLQSYGSAMIKAIDKTRKHGVSMGGYIAPLDGKKLTFKNGKLVTPEYIDALEAIKSKNITADAKKAVQNYIDAIKKYDSDGKHTEINKAERVKAAKEKIDKARAALEAKGEAPLFQSKEALADAISRFEKELDDSLQQNNSGVNSPKGMIEFINDIGGAKAVVTFFESADVSTAVHEFFHYARRDLSEEEILAAERAFGVEDGHWDDIHEEAFAEAGVKYISDGKAQTPELASIFSKITQWLKDLWAVVRGTKEEGAQLSDDMKTLFNAVFGDERAKKKLSNMMAKINEQKAAEFAASEAKRVEEENKLFNIEKQSKQYQNNSILEDVGEKIGGAKKDRWQDRGLKSSDLDEMSGGEASKYSTKENVLGKADYIALKNAGLDEFNIAAYKYLRDQLAAKPKKDTPEDRRWYVEGMSKLRDVFDELLAGQIKPQDIQSKFMQATGYSHNRNRLLKDMSDSEQKAYREFWAVMKGSRSSLGFGNYEVRKVNELIKKGLFEENKAAKTWRDNYKIYHSTKTDTYLILDKHNRPIKKDNGEQFEFDTVQKAEEFAAQYKPTKAPEPIRPYLDEIVRTGYDWRGGKSVDAKEFMDEFGFRGVEFGNWAAKDERQKIINHAFDALADLATTLNIPKKAISLNGSLGMAFGARGGGKFAAHYEPAKVVINMTKLRGAGAVAHEWGHAFDNYFGELDRPNARDGSGRYLSDPARGSRTHQEYRENNPYVREEMRAAFKNVMEAIFKKDVDKAEIIRRYEQEIERYKNIVENPYDERQKQDAIELLKENEARLDELLNNPKAPSDKTISSFYIQSRKLDGSREKPYWSTPVEMFARAFEAYVYDKIEARNESSTYLVNGSGEKYSTVAKELLGWKGNPYPVGMERSAINAAFDKLFETLKYESIGDNIRLYQDGRIVDDFASLEPVLGKLEAQKITDLKAERLKDAETDISKIYIKEEC